MRASSLRGQLLKMLRMLPLSSIEMNYMNVKRSKNRTNVKDKQMLAHIKIEKIYFILGTYNASNSAKIIPLANVSTIQPTPITIDQQKESSFCRFWILLKSIFYSLSTVLKVISFQGNFINAY